MISTSSNQTARLSSALVSPNAIGTVNTAFADDFQTWLEENPGDGKRIIEKWGPPSRESCR